MRRAIRPRTGLPARAAPQAEALKTNQETLLILAVEYEVNPINPGTCSPLRWGGNMYSPKNSMRIGVIGCHRTKPHIKRVRKVDQNIKIRIIRRSTIQYSSVSLAVA